MSKYYEYIKKILNGITARLGGDRSLENISRGSDIALALLIVSHSGHDHRADQPAYHRLHDRPKLTASNFAADGGPIYPGATSLSIFPSLLPHHDAIPARDKYRVD